MASNFSGEGEHTPSPLVCTLEPPVVSQWTPARHSRATCVRWKPTEQLGTRLCRARNEAERAHKGIQAGARACTLAWSSLISPAKFSSSSARGRSSHLLEKKRGFASSREREERREREKKKRALSVSSQRVSDRLGRIGTLSSLFSISGRIASSCSRLYLLSYFMAKASVLRFLSGLGKSFCARLTCTEQLSDIIWEKKIRTENSYGGKRCMSVVLSEPLLFFYHYSASGWCNVDRASRALFRRV